MVREPARIVPKTLCHSAGRANLTKLKEGKKMFRAFLSKRGQLTRQRSATVPR